MLIGYVSDESYLALHDVAVEIESDRGSVETRSRATGAIHADISPGLYRVTLARAGHGPKTVEVELGLGMVHQFRLLSHGLSGYMWPKWQKSGLSSQWRVHSTQPYKLELWRYGHQKELVRNLGWYDDHGPRSTMQLLPDEDFTRTGVRWNQHGFRLEYHPQEICAPERAGLHYLHAWTAGEEFFSFPWLVAPARPQAPIAVMASNITWNAYNNYGGRSNYVSQDQLLDRPTVHARLELKRYTLPDLFPSEVSAPISFDRPEPLNFVPRGDRITDPIEGRLASACAPGLWRLLGWLERESIAHDLYAETQLHWDELPLESYRVLVLDNHPEYWSAAMYRRVKDWVHHQGGRLVYLGGCGLYAEVEMIDRDRMLCRNEGRTDLRGESEAALLGVGYTHSGFQSGAPYRVLDGKHWVFEHTGLATGDLFGFRSLHERCPGGASGHELDKIQPESPANTRLLAKGTNPAESGAEMATYETASSGAVFSVGSLCWPLSLLIDDHVSRITANVLRRFLE